MKGKGTNKIKQQTICDSWKHFWNEILTALSLWWKTSFEKHVSRTIAFLILTAGIAWKTFIYYKKDGLSFKEYFLDFSSGTTFYKSKTCSDF